MVTDFLVTTVQLKGVFKSSFLCWRLYSQRKAWVIKFSHLMLPMHRGSSHSLSSWKSFPRDGEGAFLQCGLGSLWCYIPAALAGGTKGASSSLCWQSPGPSAGAEGEAAEVRLSTPSARNTVECPRDEFYSHRVLKLCPKVKKDPSDSPAFKNLPSSAQRCGFLAFGKLWTG